MITSRDIVPIINKLLNFVPIEENAIRHALTTYRDSLWNQAPEARRSTEIWQPLMIILNNFIPIIDTDWKRNMVNIVNNV